MHPALFGPEAKPVKDHVPTGHGVGSHVVISHRVDPVVVVVQPWEHGVHEVDP